MWKLLEIACGVMFWHYLSACLSETVLHAILNLRDTLKEFDWVLTGRPPTLLGNLCLMRDHGWGGFCTNPRIHCNEHGTQGNTTTDRPRRAESEDSTIGLKFEKLYFAIEVQHSTDFDVSMEIFFDQAFPFNDENQPCIWAQNHLQNWLAAHI